MNTIVLPACIATSAAMLGAQTTQSLVAPAAYAATDALSYEWIAGASRPLRQQTLIGASHLQPMLQNAPTATITGLALRRTAANEIYQGGSMQLTVTLSTCPNAPLLCDNHYAANVGPDAATVFSGTVTLPTSPATPAGVGTPVAWTAANTLQIQFAQPFTYQGGTLCVDVTGTPISGQEANWWMADAAEDVIFGTSTEIGPGCGSYGGPSHRWSQVAVRTLFPGSRARFWAFGAPNTLALTVFGAAAPAPFPLAAIGIPTPGCTCSIDLGAVLAVVPSVFVPEVHPSAAIDAIAETLVVLPPNPAWFGLQLTTQWFDLAQMATSNAFTWTVASAIPTIDMALNEGHPAETTGLVTTYLAPVMQLSYQ